MFLDFFSKKIKHDFSAPIQPQPSLADAPIVFILLYATVAIVGVNLLNDFTAFRSFTHLFDSYSQLPLGSTLQELKTFKYYELIFYFWWWWWQCLFYFLIPYGVLTRYFGIDKKQLGIAKSQQTQLNKYYAVWGVGVVLLILFVAIEDENFANYYPFYSQSSRSIKDLLAWEFLYITQFIFIEFFFRGVMMNTLYNKFGRLALFMITPYVMIHLGKPWLEVLASFPFGLFLSYMMIKTRSIWGGVLLHIFIGLSLDIVILIVTNRLPINW